MFCINDINYHTKNITNKAGSSSKVSNETFKGKSTTPSHLLNNNNNKKNKEEKKPQYNQRLLNYLKSEKGEKTVITLEEEKKNLFDKIYPIEKGIDEMTKDIANFDKKILKNENKLFFVFGDIQNNCLLGEKENDESSMVKIIMSEYIHSIKVKDSIQYWINCFSNEEELTKWLNNITNQIERVNNNDEYNNNQHNGTIKTITDLHELIKIYKKKTYNDLFGLIFSINAFNQKPIHVSFISSSNSSHFLCSIIKYIKTQNKSIINPLTSYIISICSSQQMINEITSIYEQNYQQNTFDSSLDKQSKILQTAKKAKNGSKLSSYLTIAESKNINKQLTDLLTENKELRLEIANLKIQLNSYKSLQQQIQNIPVITYELLSNEIKTENTALLKNNLELNKSYHSHLELINCISQELLNAETNVYTFDDQGNAFQCNENKINSNNKKYYHKFKESFMSFFSSLSNNDQNKKWDYASDMIHLDSLKSILNSYYCFMDTIIDDFILQKGHLPLYQKYIQASFLGVYYERIINELLNYCLYDYKRRKLYESLNSMLIQIINSLLSNSYSEGLSSVEQIKSKLNQFDKANEEHINNNKNIWLNELSSYKKIFNNLQSNSSLNTSNDTTLKENKINELFENKSHNTSLIDLRQDDINNKNQSNTKFYGYIKTEESPPMIFDDEDSQCEK